LDIVIRKGYAGMSMKQMKIYAEPELAEAFKALCAKGGTSVTAELSAYMRERTRLKEPTTETGVHTDRRGQRRTAVRKAILMVENVPGAEESYRDSIPENLCGGPPAEAADEAVARLADAIEALSEAYGA
jgi:hypothetical protein